jgi:1-deoxy-D-xylulose 5-phosphate reductoisomerase
VEALEVALITQELLVTAGTVVLDVVAEAVGQVLPEAVVETAEMAL